LPTWTLKKTVYKQHSKQSDPTGGLRQSILEHSTQNLPDPSTASSFTYVGRREDAQAIQPELHQCIVAFKSDLALSLNNPSAHLSDVGCPKDASEAMQATVELDQQLDTDHSIYTYRRKLRSPADHSSRSQSRLGCLLYRG